MSQYVAYLPITGLCQQDEPCLFSIQKKDIGPLDSSDARVHKIEVQIPCRSQGQANGVGSPHLAPASPGQKYVAQRSSKPFPSARPYNHTTIAPHGTEVRVMVKHLSIMSTVVQQVAAMDSAALRIGKLRIPEY